MRALLRLLLCVCAVGSSHGLPNIVLLFADDLGYGDLGAFGHPTSSTPNLDRLAAEGLVLTQFYSASPVCSPSRAALMTGRYQTRSGVYPKVFDPDSIGGLPLNETTIAEVLKSVGYSTAMVGKWHLGVGESRQFLPTHQGFDYYMGIPYSHNQCPNTVCFYPNEPCSLKNKRWVPCPVFENEQIVQQPADLLTLTSSYMTAATSFIKTKASSGSPFFLYVAFQHTHNPMFASKRFTNATIRGAFGDSLAELDWGVGEVLGALQEAGVEENTLVFFTTDNGPNLIGRIAGGSGGLLRCGKGTTWEGGQRVPAIARWKGTITPGGRTYKLAATLDLLPTLAKLTGAQLPDVTLDGTDMSPVLFGEGESSRDSFVYYPNDVNVEKRYGIHAVRLQQYKARFYSHGYLCPNDYYDEVCRDNYTLRAYDPPLLFNLHTDPGELYPLNVTQYSSVMDGINKFKKQFERGMVWGVSQMERGTSNSSEACAKPGCQPFPSCCTTNTLDIHTSRVIT